jgi:DNA-binding transcriptional regulator YdaS (Cro superfamily)
MSLIDYLESFPRSERVEVRKKIANFVGVHESAVKHWANGTRKPSPKSLSALAEFTGLPKEILRKDISQPTSEPTPPSQ